MLLYWWGNVACHAGTCCEVTGGRFWLEKARKSFKIPHSSSQLVLIDPPPRAVVHFVFFFFFVSQEVRRRKNHYFDVMKIATNWESTYLSLAVADKNRIYTISWRWEGETNRTPLKISRWSQLLRVDDHKQVGTVWGGVGTAHGLLSLRQWARRPDFTGTWEDLTRGQILRVSGGHELQHDMGDSAAPGMNFSL